MERNGDPSVGRARTAAIAALAGSLIIAGGTPAHADGEPLAVSSTGLTEGQLIGAQIVLHPVLTGTDITQVQVIANGLVQHTYTSVPAAMPLQFSFLVSWPDQIAVTIRIADAAGRTAEATTTVHLDAVQPTATFSPAPGSVVHGTSVTVTPASLSGDVARIDLIDASSTVLASATEAPWSFTRNLPAGVVGNISLLLRVYDNAGNKTTYQPTYAIDNQGPKVTVDWPYGSMTGVIPGGSTFNPYVSARDTAGVDRVEWWSAGALVSTGTSLVHDFGRTSRTVAFEVRAWDRLGNESITPVTVRVDATGPTITSLSPMPGAFVRGTYYHSTVKASDPSGIGWMTLNGAGIDATPNSAVAVGKDGTRVWTWVVYDSFGNPSTARRTVTVDNTKPSLKVTSAPNSGANVKGTVTIKASASDHNGINRVELLINGKIAAKDTTSGYSFSINTKKYGKTIKVQLRAYDKAGNSYTTPTRTWHR
jgi:hypothetical protein